MLHPGAGPFVTLLLPPEVVSQSVPAYGCPHVLRSPQNCFEWYRVCHFDDALKPLECREIPGFDGEFLGKPFDGLAECVFEICKIKSYSLRTGLLQQLSYTIQIHRLTREFTPQVAIQSEFAGGGNSLRQRNAKIP